MLVRSLNKAFLKKSDPYNLNVRETETDHKPIPKSTVYEYTLSHGRALARSKPYSDVQYFQGSSLLRKKKPINDKETGKGGKKKEATINDAIEGGTPFSQILGIKKMDSRKSVDGFQMSRRTRIKIQEKILAIYSAKPNDFFFITLTLIESVPDTKGVKILNKFLTVLRKQYGQFNYLWVAERQQNGNIHFHMICDKRFDIIYINSLWTAQQVNAGLYHKNISRLMRSEKQSISKLHKSGVEGQRKIQKYFNPVDVFKVDGIDGLSCYLTQYITKNETKMSCAVWHCNRNISRVFTKQVISNKIFLETCDNTKNKIVNKKGKVYKGKVYVHQYGMINTIMNKQYFKKYLSEMILINKWILNGENIDVGFEMKLKDYLRFLYKYRASKAEQLTAILSGRLVYQKK